MILLEDRFINLILFSDLILQGFQNLVGLNYKYDPEYLQGFGNLAGIVI